MILCKMPIKASACFSGPACIYKHHSHAVATSPHIAQQSRLLARHCGYCPPAPSSHGSSPGTEAPCDASIKAGMNSNGLWCCHDRACLSQKCRGSINILCVAEAKYCNESKKPCLCTPSSLQPIDWSCCCRILQSKAYSNTRNFMQSS